nr:LOW QUALITY PROTEIN: cholinesterase-like [Dermatophagoides farinae]
MYKFTLIAIVFNFCLISSSRADEEFAPIVNLRHGKVRGLVRTVIDGDKKTKIYFYQGFRYGHANRFEKPTMVTSWPGDIYNATKLGNSCIQFGDQFLQNATSESEDCLFLNVYKPVTNNEKLLPVMVWIHGGGFQIGSIFYSFYDASFLASYGEVIVVSINYRLGPFGFLYGGNSDAPGNVGFHDQLLGLKWVQENIKNFGGDPNKVTIFGESAGSMSVSALVQSPLAKNLFTRAIMQSGAGATFYSITKTALTKTIKLSEKVNCKKEDIEQTIACLKTKSIEEIKKSLPSMTEDVMFRKSFTPIFGDEVLPNDAILYKNYFNRVDVIFGNTHDEGSLFAMLYLPELMNDNNTFTMGKIHEMISNLVDKMELKKSNEVISYYTKTLNVSNLNEVRKVFGDIIGDCSLLCPTMLFGQRIARDSNFANTFYSYRLDRRAVASLAMGCPFEWMGVCHGEDVMYLFNNPALKSSPVDIKLSREMITAWTNFAKTGHPGKIGSIEWRQVYENGQKTSPSVMLLDDKSKMAEGIFKDLCDGFWQKIYESIN